MDFNPYKVLAVDPSADPDIVAAAYRTLSKKYHPDVNKAPDAESRMREINRAYDMLKDPEQRRKTDADLARSTGSGRNNSPGTNTNYGGYNPPRSSNRASGPDLSAMAEEIRRRADSAINNVRDTRPNTPNDRTLYFYQKQLADDVQRKSLKVSVFHDGPSNRKLCNIKASAPNHRGQITTGEVFLDSAIMFDLTLAVAEAVRMLNETGSPIEMNADHDVYFRLAVPGLGKTYIAVEVIKKTRGSGTHKEVLLLLGEKNARTERDGVVAEQTPTQIQQIARIFQSALEAMR